MKVVLCNFIPFKGFLAMTFYNVIIARKDEYEKCSKEEFTYTVNHEEIHEAQMKDFCKFIPIGGTVFYLIYFFEWIFRLLTTWNLDKAYRNISFEREAYTYTYDLKYLKERPRFAQWKSDRWM